jgi:hypothetical protein
MISKRPLAVTPAVTWGLKTLKKVSRNALGVILGGYKT